MNGGFAEFCDKRHTVSIALAWSLKPHDIITKYIIKHNEERGHLLSYVLTGILLSWLPSVSHDMVSLGVLNWHGSQEGFSRDTLPVTNLS